MNKIHGGNIYEIARQFNLNPGEIIDFSAPINPLGISKRAERKMREGFSAVLHYPDPHSADLTQTLAQFHGLKEDQILAGAGSTEFIYAIPRILQPRRVLIMTPAFSEYENALEGSDCSIHFFEAKEEDGFEVSVEGLLLTLTEGYDALYLGNPNNPTGILTEKKDLLKVLGKTEQEKIWLILDEAFIDFIEEESLKKEAASCSRLIILRSLTKFFALPGLRVGYIISNGEVIHKFSENKEPWTVNVLAQIVATESLKDRGYITRAREFIVRERDYLTHGLRSIPGLIPYPSMANYLFVQLHPSLDLSGAELRRKLIPHGILIRDCSSFHHIGPFFFRIAVRSRKENNALLKALRQVCRETHVP